MTPLLEVDDVELSFGGVRVLDGVSLSVRPGEVVGLIGPNGAGKTTVINLITGFARGSRGAVRFAGETISTLAPHQIAARGIRRTFQTSYLCGGLTVLENVMLGITPGMSYGIVGACAGSGAARTEEARVRKAALDMLEWVGIPELAGRDGHSLSFGQQRLVELARAMIARPKLLILDEPAVGLSPARAEDLTARIAEIARTMNVAVLLSEHVIQMVLDCSDCIVVMGAGRVIAQGSGAEISADPAVIESYLGRGYHVAG